MPISSSNLSALGVTSTQSTARTLLHSLCLLFACLTLTACEILNKGQHNDPLSNANLRAEYADLNHQALQQVSDRDVHFAQTALSRLGYRVGGADGIWGERSATAMLAFEKSRGLRSAGGALSELNLYALSKVTNVRKSEIESSIRHSKSLASKLDDSLPLADAPQLIIVDQTYPVLANANPYSEVLLTLQPGTGVYVIGHQGGWFEVESLSRIKGYIREN